MFRLASVKVTVIGNKCIHEHFHESLQRKHIVRALRLKYWQYFYLHRVRGNIMCIANLLHVGIPSVALSVINQPRVYTRGLHIDKF